MHSVNKSSKKWFSKSSLRFGIFPSELLLDKRLTPQCVRFLMAIIVHASPDGICVVTQATLGEWISKSNGEPLGADQVGNIAQRLEALGWITYRRSGKNCPNRYQLLFPEIPANDFRVITNRKIDDAEHAKKMESMKTEQVEYARKMRHKRAIQYDAEREARHVAAYEASLEAEAKPVRDSGRPAAPRNREEWSVESDAF
ncbi:hypothetical protein [Paraburkholderia hospita]|uniref:hypothetical protein n=1 Tax=Paraburkholderia hospita TaxID=169430 RepID=UPI0002716194|nr:hypothetical protein [Paraburkholderia hospita]EUC15019.1 hypothetical protein PMI06_006195 [Burkholderia sp. BT03]SKC94367.1 hypothetical protein SAMN06266956_6245 [Paraburkholderia hospita]